MPLNDKPSTVASNVASSTKVDIAEVTAFHSSGDFVFAKNTNYINQEADSKHFKHSYFS
jgi:hypothetical protein